jgi:hypothetical protein
VQEKRIVLGFALIGLACDQSLPPVRREWTHKFRIGTVTTKQSPAGMGAVRLSGQRKALQGRIKVDVFDGQLEKSWIWFPKYGPGILDLRSWVGDYGSWAHQH